MSDQRVGGETTGRNVAGEEPAEVPEAVTDEVTVQDEGVELERTIGSREAGESAAIGRPQARGGSTN